MSTFRFALVIFFGAHLLVGTAAKLFYWPSFTNAQLASASDNRQAIGASHQGEVESEQTGKMPLWTPYMFGGMPGFPLVTTGVPSVHPLPIYLGFLFGVLVRFILYGHTLLFDVIVLSAVFIARKR